MKPTILMRLSARLTLMVAAAALLLLIGTHGDLREAQADVPANVNAQVPDVFNILVIRAYFPDYPVNTTDVDSVNRFSRQEVADLFNNEVSDLWQTTSYGNLTIHAEVTPEIMLDYNGGGRAADPPWPKAWYSNGKDKWFNGKDLRRAGYTSALKEFEDGNAGFRRQRLQALPTMWDADNDNFDWDNIDGYFIMLLEPNSIQQYDPATGRHTATNDTATYLGTNRTHLVFDDARGANNCSEGSGLPAGVRAGCGTLMEGRNYSKSNPDLFRPVSRTWGVFAHETGHMLGAGHPSQYQSRFELMDTLYPGHIGALCQDGLLPRMAARQQDICYGRRRAGGRHIYLDPRKALGRPGTSDL